MKPCASSPASNTFIAGEGSRESPRSLAHQMISEEAAAIFAAEGLAPQMWSNRAGDEYGWHQHDYHKVLICVAGSITFHLRGEDREIRARDRLDLPPQTDHAATVGPKGVTCWEAARR